MVGLASLSLGSVRRRSGESWHSVVLDASIPIEVEEGIASVPCTCSPSRSPSLQGFGTGGAVAPVVLAPRWFPIGFGLDGHGPRVRGARQAGPRREFPAREARRREVERTGDGHPTAKGKTAPRSQAAGNRSRRRCGPWCGGVPLAGGPYRVPATQDATRPTAAGFESRRPALDAGAAIADVALTTGGAPARPVGIAGAVRFR